MKIRPTTIFGKSTGYIDTVTKTFYKVLDAKTQMFSCPSSIHYGKIALSINIIDEIINFKVKKFRFLIEGFYKVFKGVEDMSEDLVYVDISLDDFLNKSTIIHFKGKKNSDIQRCLHYKEFTMVPFRQTRLRM